MAMPCGWCLAGDHLIHADGRPPCGCRCAVSTTRLVPGQSTAWRYRCEACGYRRTGRHDEMTAIEARHEEEHVNMYERAWAMLDAIVERIADAKRVVDTSDWHSRGPEEHEKALHDVALAQEQGRGASAVLATMIQVQPGTVAAEVGCRMRARAAGRTRRVLNSAELRGYHETPNHGGFTDEHFEERA